MPLAGAGRVLLGRGVFEEVWEEGRDHLPVWLSFWDLPSSFFSISEWLDTWEA